MPILYRGAEGDMVRAKITWTFRDGNDAICCYLLKGNRNKLRYVQSQIGESCHGFQVFANYSWLSSGPPIHIAATELRGITIEQLSSLQLGLNEHATGYFQFHFWVSLAKNLNNLKLGRLVFIEDIASSWCDAHHLAYGQPLSVEVSALFGRRSSDRC